MFSRILSWFSWSSWFPDEEQDETMEPLIAGSGRDSNDIIDDDKTLLINPSQPDLNLDTEDATELTSVTRDINGGQEPRVTLRSTRATLDDIEAAGPSNSKPLIAEPENASPDNDDIEAAEPSNSHQLVPKQSDKKPARQEHCCEELNDCSHAACFCGLCWVCIGSLLGILTADGIIVLLETYLIANYGEEFVNMLTYSVPTVFAVGGAALGFIPWAMGLNKAERWEAERREAEQSYSVCAFVGSLFHCAPKTKNTPSAIETPTSANSSETNLPSLRSV